MKMPASAPAISAMMRRGPGSKTGSGSPSSVYAKLEPATHPVGMATPMMIR
jgi:hypothetical protein